jgi:transcriptional regulator with XRE-family HTH domain
MASMRDADRALMSLFAEELRAARNRAGWSRDELAERLRYSPSLVGMIETGHRVPQLQFASRCDEVFAGTGTFVRIARQLRALSFPAGFRPFASYESEAKALRAFEHSLIPGILQTEQYARAVLSTRPNTNDEEVEDLLAARLARQTILDHDNPPLLWVLLDESVLHRPVAPPEVMRAQLLGLVEIAQRANVTIQVVPYSAGGHSGLLGSFTIADLPDGSSIVYLEDAADGRVTEDPATVSEVGVRFDTLRSEALPKTASRKMVEEVANERWT